MARRLGTRIHSIAGLLLVGVLLLIPIGGWAANDPLALARVEVPGMLTDLDLPVYAHLQGADKSDYALVLALISELRASGADLTILHTADAAVAGKRYLIALERIAGARAGAGQLVHVLHDDGRHLIVLASAAEARALGSLGFEVQWLPDEPMILAMPETALLPFALDYDPAVAQMIAKVNSSDVSTYCGNLSGVNTVKIGGADYKISTRNTNNGTWTALATQYAYEFFQAQGLAASYHVWSGALRNVIAEKPGGAKANEIILITAHLDDMPSSGAAPGADDNASGSVGVMLAARIMKDYAFDRTIRFVLFTGEEQGLYGSSSYAQKVYSDGDKIVAVVNLDMIAWDKAGGPVARLHTRTTSNPGYAGDKAIADTLIGVVSTYGLGGSLAPIIDADGITASDHSSFWNKGFAGILAIEDDQDDFNSYYHTSSDSLDKLNLPYFTAYVKACLGATAHLAGPVKEGLHAAFTYNAELLKLSFTDQSTCTGCTITSWAWDFGDGLKSAEQNPVHTYAQEGTYTVKLTVTNNKAETDSLSQSVKVSKILPYCDAASNNASYEWIAKVAVGAFAKSSAGSTYSDFTADVIPAAKGAPVAVTLTPGFNGGQYAEYWRVWADLNQDGDFEDAGEKLFEGSSTGPVTGNITIPASAKDGATRLRVSMSYGAYANPCGSFSYGEVEDYTLNIGGGAPQYCAAQGDSQGYEWIKQVAVGGYTKASKASKYSDFTAEKIAVTRGQAVSVTLTPGFRFAGVKYPENWRVWADVNRDGDFDDAGELLLQASSENPVTGNITIPSSAAAGVMRLRVSMSYGSYPTPCGSAEYGEVEDYSLDVK